MLDVHICTTNRISHSRVLSFSKKTGAAVGVNAISPAVSVQSLDQHDRLGLQKQESLLCFLTDHSNKQPVWLDGVQFIAPHQSPERPNKWKQDFTSCRVAVKELLQLAVVKLTVYSV